MKTRSAFTVAWILLASARAFAADTVVVPYSGPGADIPISVIRQHMMDDPNFLARVAQAEGMTPARLMGQGEGRIMALARKYLADQRKTIDQQPKASEPTKTGK